MSATTSAAASHDRWVVQPLKDADFAARADDWDRVADRLVGAHPMLRSAFVGELIRCFSPGDLYLVELHREAQLAGLALLRRRRGTGLWSSFTPPQAQVGPVLLPSDACLESLVRALPGHAARLDLLCNDPLFGDLSGRAQDGREVQLHALTMHVDLQGSFADYWARRPRKLVQNLQRYERRAQQLGQLRFVCHESPEAVEAGVLRYAELEAQGWKGRLGTALAPDNLQTDFYRRYLGQKAAHARCLVAELWLDETLVASRLVVFTPDMAIALKTSYSEEHKTFAPGRLLQQRTIEELFRRQQARRFELYTDADEHALAWGDGVRWIHHVEVFRSTGARRWLGLLRQLRHRGSRTLDARIAIERHAPAEVPEDVRAFMARFESEHLELGADWFQLLTRTVFPAPGLAALHVLRFAGRPVAVLPTLAVEGELTGLANYYTAYFEPLLDGCVGPHELLPLWQAARAHAPEAHRYRFAPMDPQRRAFLVLAQTLRLDGLPPFPYFGFGNWYLRVPADWDAYLKSRSANLRSMLKRTSKRLLAEGARVEVLTQLSDFERAMAAYEKVYAASWKVHEPYPEFVRGLVARLESLGQMRLGLVWKDEEPIAAQIWYVNGGTASIFKVAYDEAHKALGSGTVLTAELLRHVLEHDGVREVDFLIGDDAYKRSWMSDRRERWGLVAYNPRHWKGFAGLLRKRLGGWAKRALPQTWLARLRPGADSALPTAGPEAREGRAAGGDRTDPGHRTA